MVVFFIIHIWIMKHNYWHIYNRNHVYLKLLKISDLKPMLLILFFFFFAIRPNKSIQWNFQWASKSQNALMQIAMWKRF